MENQSVHNNQKAKVIFNPHAGKKRRAMFKGNAVSIEDIKFYLKKYQIPADFFPTKYAGHATKLAKASVVEGYDMVIVAGGDGTISEVANGLINTKMTMGIIPLGTYMNTPRMLSIPSDNIELTFALLKLKRTREIDVVQIIALDGIKLEQPTYYLENASVGFEAIVQQHTLELENGDVTAIYRLIKDLIGMYTFSVTVTCDDTSEVIKTVQVSLSNGPYTGAGMLLAPKAKLNDHLITVAIFKMTKWEVMFFFLRLMKGKRKTYGKVETRQAEHVTITSRKKRPVHADARKYGKTPIEVMIIPNALRVVTGFAEERNDALLKKTYLNP